MAEKKLDHWIAQRHPGLEQGRYVISTVSDNGRGMDAVTRERVFEPLFSTNFQGRGLAMAAAYGIVKSHDGYIYVDSIPEKGTAVRVFLPASPAGAVL